MQADWLPSAAPSLPELFHLPGFYAPFSAASHLLGAAAFGVLGYRLPRKASHGGGGGRGRLVFLAVYAASSVLLLAASGAYHMARPDAAGHATLLRIDHAAIFILIVGSFTPVHGLLFLGPLRWAPLMARDTWSGGWHGHVPMPVGLL